MKKKIIPRNYLILTGLVVLVICACLAFNNIYKIYYSKNAKTSPFEECNQLLYEDLKNATKDIGGDTFLIISYTDDYDVIENEKNIYKYLKKNNLLDNVMYLNITEYIANEDFNEELNKLLKLDTGLTINKYPALVYYRDGLATITIDSTDHLLNKGDFEQLVDMYELAG